MENKIVVCKSCIDECNDLMNQLKNNGFNVIVSPRDGEAMIGYIEEKRPIAVICEAFMPNRDAIGVMQKFKDLKYMPKFIVVSSSNNMFLEKEIMKNGASYFVLKPFSTSSLVSIIKNTVEICNAVGIENPKVAPLAAVEVVNPKMPVTVEADQLTKMNEAGEITGCIVDGPLSMDLATCPEAAQHKGASGRKIVGDADVLLFPDIHAGNILYKGLVHFSKSKNGNLITGTAAPVILTSRSDSFEVKVNSLALGALVADSLKKNATK